MILVDTSSWIDHFRKRDPELVALLEGGRVASCSIVRAELRLGSGVPRAVVPLLARLPDLPVPSAEAALVFLDRHEVLIASLGIGFADLLLMACAVDAGCPIRTTDRRLAAAWSVLGFAAG